MLLILYTRNEYNDFITVALVPIVLLLAEKAINTYIDTSNKHKLINDAKLFYECGVITDEEYKEKKQYIRQKLEDIDYVKKTTISSTNTKNSEVNFMKFLKENIKMIVLLSIIIVLFPVVILIVSSKKLMPLNTGLAIIGYGGAIIGGLLTLFGVTMTINHEKKTREKDIIAQEDQRIDNLAIQYRPILKVKIHDIKNNNDCYKITYINCGRGEAINIRLHTLRDTKNYVTLTPAVVDMVPSNESNTVSLSFTSSFFENNVSYLDFDIEISYKDLYEKYLIKTVVNVIIERKTIVKSIPKSICTKRYNDCLKNYSFNIYGNSINIEKIK